MSKSTSDTKLPPGRDLNAMVAEKIMGWRWVKFGPKNGSPLTAIVPPIHMYNNPHRQQPSDALAERYDDWDMLSWNDEHGRYHRGLFLYSSDIADAYSVVEAMRELDFWFSCSFKSGIFENDQHRAGWRVRFRCVRAGIRGDHTAVSESLPHAICLAALSAVRAEGKEVRP